jgi:CubicO group peptidase (beta-lactamase class C family)
MTVFSEMRSLIATNMVQQVLDSPDLHEGFSIACLIDHELHSYASGGKHPFSADTRVDIGCVMKNLTALLVAIATSEGHLGYERSVAEYFPENPSIDRALQMRHLLSQSHGLDGSTLPAVPYGSEGYIDSEAIWREVGKVPPISRPGAIFYYWGSVGYWVAAAILERIYGLTFEVIRARR